MRAVILAGGLGTRLLPYTTVLPKPLVPLGERPVLEHVLLQLDAHGFTHIDLCVAHLGELIRAYFMESRSVPKRLELAWRWEDEPLGTAGALRMVPDLEGTFLAMNGDILTNLDYTALMDYHVARDAALTVAVHQQQVNIDLGVIESSDDLIIGYREKPVLGFEVSMGIYAYDARVLRHLPDGQCQFPDLVQILLDAGERVAVFRDHAAEWFDIGTVGQLERATQRLAERPDLFDPARHRPPGGADAPGEPTASG